MSDYMGSNYDLIYHLMMRDIFYSEGRELIAPTFVLTDPRHNKVRSEARAFREEFADRFFNWTWEGHSDISELFGDNPNARKFEPEVGGRNTAYGPRIKRQWEGLMQELEASPESRRATLLILEADDQEILPGKREGNLKTEYPCTIALTFMVRGNALNCHAMMRSNNMVTTVCYDVYNFTNLMFKAWQRLRKTYPALLLGSYYHTATSAHIVEDELGLAEKILAERGLLRGGIRHD